jgi:hypothetical protein
VARRLAALLLVNLATRPLVWFLLPGLAARYTIRVAVSEAWAFGAEAGAYLVIWPRLGVRRAFAISVLANGASVGVGILVSMGRYVHLYAWPFVAVRVNAP